MRSIVTILFLMVFSLSGCLSQKKLVTKPPYQLGDATYQKWSGGRAESGKGIYVEIPVEKILNEKFTMQYVYFRGQVAQLKINEVDDKIIAKANFKDKNQQKADLIMHDDPRKEVGNQPPPVKQPEFPFEINDDEAIVSFVKGEKVKYFKITGLKEKKAVFIDKRYFYNLKPYALLQKLFKQTFIYGLATVLPRLLSFILVPVYTSVMPTELYGEVSLIFMSFAIFNVVLAYGMETTFFRFYSKEENKDRVVSTSLLSILLSSFLFFIAGWYYQSAFAQLLNIKQEFINYILAILVLDALVIIPFAWLRANEKPIKYAVVKILSVVINFGLNIFFIISLPTIAMNHPQGLIAELYRPDFEISYILISNVIASGVAFLFMSGLYFKSSLKFDIVLWRKMIKYALPVLIAGIGFTINEVFDRYLLSELLPADIAKSEIGKYSGCYKISLFMAFFATAFRLGIEPFFFSHAKTKKPQIAYAQITYYFVVFGSLILLGVIVFVHPLKEFIVRDSSYWEALSIVPIILLASFCLGIYHNLSVWYKVTDRTKFGAYISVIGAVLTLAINYIFIPKIGYMASAIATLTAYGSMMLLSYLIGKKYYPIPYNLKRIGLFLGVSILFSAISFYRFNGKLIIGTLLLLVFLALIFLVEGKNIKSIIQKK